MIVLFLLFILQLLGSMLFYGFLSLLCVRAFVVTYISMYDILNVIKTFDLT